MANSQKWYACVADTEHNGRCRNESVPSGRWMCVQHNAMADAGQDVPVVGLADVVLLKFNLNPTWKAKMEAMGVRELNRDVEKEERKHVQHAEDHNRDAFKYRGDEGISDSGVPIFGNKIGAHDVSLFELLKELVAVYEIVDVHIKPRRDKRWDKEKKKLVPIDLKGWMWVLTVSFSHGSASGINSGAFQEVMEFLASSCWGYAHVWANAPQADGRVVQTINISHRQPEMQPKLALRLGGGKYSTKPYVEPAKPTE